MEKMNDRAKNTAKMLKDSFKNLTEAQKELALAFMAGLSWRDTGQSASGPAA